MKQQSNAGSEGDELDFVKYRKRTHCDETDELSNFVQKKRFQNQNRFGVTNGQCEEYQDGETIIRETQAALKSLSGSWSETNSPIRKETEESSVFPNLFDDRNGHKIMSPITTTAFNSNSSSAYRESYYLNGKPKLCTQSKRPRLNDSKYQSSEFNEIVGDGTNQTDKLTLQSDKSETIYENTSTTSEYQSNRSVPTTTATFSQSSAFHPPSFDSKKSNPFGSMSHSAYHYTDSSGYSTYSSLDLNASTNGSPERERTFGKAFSKDDDMNATDYKEYTTLQPAGVGSKAASVIQDVSRDGGGVPSVVVMNSMSNANAQNTTTTTIAGAAAAAAASNERAFLERPIAAFSPGSTNKGKTILTQNKCLLHV